MSNKKFVSFLSVSFFFIINLPNLPLLFAQENQSEEFTLEEITVTAQKREENQQKVPIAMEVITSDQLTELGKTDIDEVLSGVSSVIVNRASDGLRVSIRGLGDTFRTQNGMSASMPMVAVNTDGAMSNRNDKSSGLYDVERVEVLYGPQSTLYSTNSPGGIVNVVTANPKIDKFGVTGLIEIGNYSLLHLEGSMNAPVSDKLAFRAAVSTIKHNGYMSNGSSDQDLKSGRLKTLFQANDKLSFVVTGEISKTDNHGNGAAEPFDTQDGSWYSGGGQSAFTYDGKVTDPWRSAEPIGPVSTTTNKKLSGHMEWGMPFGTFSLLPSYSTGTGTSYYIQYQGGVWKENKQDMVTRERSFEMRIASPSESIFKWIVGATYYKLFNFRGGVDYYLNTGIPTGSFHYYWVTDTMKAAFVNITYPFTDRFRVTGGYRYSKDDLGDDMYETEGGNNIPGRRSWPEHNEAPDFKLGVEYDLGTESMLYTDWSSSYVMQGMGGGGPPGTEVYNPPPEKVKAYTIGSKNRLFGNKLQLNASAYYYNFINYPTTVAATTFQSIEDPYSQASWSSNYFSFDSNSTGFGKGYMMGADLQTSWVITTQDMLNLSISYEKTKWTNFMIHYKYHYTTTANVGGPDGSGETQVDSSTIVPLADVDLSGRSMSLVPAWSGTLSYSHSFILWNGGAIKAQVDERFKSSYRLSWDTADYLVNKQETFHITNLSAIYTHSNGIWTLSANVKNLENYSEKTGYMGGAVGKMMVGDPRTYSAVLSVKY